jgi:hypothetical protein
MALVFGLHYLKVSPPESISLTQSAHLSPLGVRYSRSLAPHPGQTPTEC